MVNVTNPPNVNTSQLVVDSGLDFSAGDWDIVMRALRTVDGRDISALCTYQYWNVLTSQHIRTFSVAAQEATPYALFFNPAGTKMYVMGNTGDDVNEYDLSTPWDVSTAVFLQLFSIAVQEDSPQALFFNPAGTKMYVMGTTGDDVNEYDLGTAWDVTTAVWLQLFSVAGEDITPTGLFFNPAGTKMYVVGTTGDNVYEYDLGTGWDVTTAVWLQTFNVGGEEASPQALSFNPAGTKMYVVGTTGDNVYEYDLGTPWDVSTAVFLQLFSVAGEETDPSGLFFKPDGSKMYVVGSARDAVNEYFVGSCRED